jgi:hypothetical protein
VEDPASCLGGEIEQAIEHATAYLNALLTASTFAIQGNTLELRTADDELAARYVVAAP